MKNKNIFEKNAKIPDVVQQKANAAFATIYTCQDKPDEKPQKTHRSARATIIKIASAVVAAAITIAVFFTAISYFADKGPELSEGSNQFMSNQFMIRVCAAELEPEAPLPISMDVSNQAYGYGYDWTGCVNYQINFPISVEGENISDVTFKADNAVFEVVSIDCPSIVKSGSPKTLDDFSSTYVNGYDMSGHPIGKTEVGYYDSFSADYGTLQNSKYLLNICNVLTDRMDLYYVLSYEGSEDWHDDWCVANTYLVKDIEITIEVTFNDGTTASRSLGLFANQYPETDITTDGIEYTYNAVQIFCYDKDAADDATKQLISSQINRAMENGKTEEANNPVDADTAYDDEIIDDTDATDSTETTAGTETSAGTETFASTESSVGTEGTEATDEAGSVENTDNTGNDD